MSCDVAAAVKSLRDASWKGAFSVIIAEKTWVFLLQKWDKAQYSMMLRAEQVSDSIAVQSRRLLKQEIEMKWKEQQLQYQKMCIWNLNLWCWCHRELTEKLGTIVLT